MKKFVKNKYFIVTVISIIIYLIYLKLMKIFPFGENSILKSDLYQQYINFLCYLREVLLHRKSIVISWNMGLANNFYTTFAYYLMSPLNLFVVFFNSNNMDIFVELVTGIKIVLMANFMVLYLDKSYKYKSYESILFGLIYAFSSYVICYSFHIMWLDCVYMLPIVLLFVDKYIETGKIYPLVLSLSYSILTNYYIGYIVAFFSGIYFLAKIFMERKSFKYNLNNNKIEESEINYINYNFKEKSFLKYNEKINYILPDFNRYHPEVMFYQKEKKAIKILKCYSKKKLEEKEREKQEKNNKDFTPIKFPLKHNLNQPKELNSNNNTNLVEDSNKDKDVKIINENLENENNNNDNDFKNEQYQIKINRTNSFEEQEKERENEYEQNEQNDGIEQVQQNENEEQNIEQSEEKREKQSDEYNEEQNEEQIDEEKEVEDDELNYSINLFFFYILFPFSLINLFTKEEEFQSHITLDKISIIHDEDQIEEYNKIQNEEEYHQQSKQPKIHLLVMKLSQLCHAL